MRQQGVMQNMESLFLKGDKKKILKSPHFNKGYTSKGIL